MSDWQEQARRRRERRRRAVQRPGDVDPTERVEERIVADLSTVTGSGAALGQALDAVLAVQRRALEHGEQLDRLVDEAAADVAAFERRLAEDRKRMAQQRDQQIRLEKAKDWRGTGSLKLYDLFTDELFAPALQAQVERAHQTALKAFLGADIEALQLWRRQLVHLWPMLSGRTRTQLTARPAPAGPWWRELAAQAKAEGPESD